MKSPKEFILDRYPEAEPHFKVSAKQSRQSKNSQATEWSIFSSVEPGAKCLEKGLTEEAAWLNAAENFCK